MAPGQPILNVMVSGWGRFMFKRIFALVFVVLGCWAVQPVHAANICQSRPASDAFLPLPALLTPNVKKAFDLHGMEPTEIQNLTVTRCMDGHIYACFAGANLPCGKADISTNRPAITAWCKENPSVDSVPFYVSGHDTAYNWHCTAGQARIEPPSAALDANGFFKAYWRLVD